LIELMHAVWLAKKIIELVCSGTLAQAAQDYTLELNRASRELGPKGTGRRSPSFSDRERQLRAEFLPGITRTCSPAASRPLVRPAPACGESAMTAQLIAPLIPRVPGQAAGSTAGRPRPGAYTSPRRNSRRSRMDESSRVADRAMTSALGWQPGDG
jgi:hypothetical protein